MYVDGDVNQRSVETTLLTIKLIQIRTLELVDIFLPKLFELFRYLGMTVTS
jgi:hypothetical protein